MSPARKTIQDNYDILEEIGRGGMARVYMANQLSLGRVVAIKEIKSAFTSSPELVERFKREAKTSASLVHENIVQVYNFGEAGRGSLFIVMEHVDGVDLKTLFNRAGTVPPRVAAIIGREIARALSYAHARGLVHRDVKPGNVMISNQGEVKLMDFGIVREMGSDLTRTGVMLGTPSYMAPEQYLGEEITPASDIFSMGVVLYEIMAGQKPFRGDSEDSLAKKVMAKKEAKLRSINSGIPRRLQSITHRCLKKVPEKRVASAEELGRALDRFIKSESREDDRSELARWVSEVVGADKKAPAVSSDREKSRRARASSLPHEALPGTRKKTLPEAPLTTKLAASGRVSVRAPANPDFDEDIEQVESRTARKKKPAYLDPEEESGLDPGEWIVKWLWRTILLAIVALAALIMFLVFNPEE